VQSTHSTEQQISLHRVISLCDIAKEYVQLTLVGPAHLSRIEQLIDALGDALDESTLCGVKDVKRAKMRPSGCASIFMNSSPKTTLQADGRTCSSAVFVLVLLRVRPPCCSQAFFSSRPCSAQGQVQMIPLHWQMTGEQRLFPFSAEVASAIAKDRSVRNACSIPPVLMQHAPAFLFKLPSATQTVERSTNGWIQKISIHPMQHMKF
jgi:hypothetical protein